MNYWPCYAGDYMRDTADLTLAEHGAFFLLMCFAYSTERPLPPGSDQLNRMVRAYTDEEREAVIRIADRFFPVSADGLRHNARVDAEIIKASLARETARANGLKGGRPKAVKNRPGLPNETRTKPDGFPAGQPIAKRTETSPSPAPSPSPSPSSSSSSSPSASDALACSGDISPDLDPALSLNAEKGGFHEKLLKGGSNGGPMRAFDVIPEEVIERAREAT